MNVQYFNQAFIAICSLFCLFSCTTPPETLEDELSYLKAESMLLYLQGCDANHARSCSIIGTMYFKGDGVPQNFAKAAIPLKKACDLGEVRSCTFLGLMYEKGHGVKQDVDKAIAIYQSACHAGDPMGCSNVASLFSTMKSGSRAESPL